MRLVLTGRHVDITPHLRKLVDRKLAKLDRMFGDAIVSAQVILTREKYRRVAELVVHTRGDHMLHGAADHASWEQSLTGSVEKIVKQGKRVKGKWQERKRHATAVKTVAGRAAATATAAEPPEPAGPRIVRTSRYAAKPMTVEEAAREVDAARDGLLVFRNASTDSINVLYRRKNGDFGLIEPEA
jgi:putative sigma-54 modulation protein